MCYRCGRWIRGVITHVWLDGGDRWLCERCNEKLRHRYDRSVAYPTQLLEEL